MSSGKKLAKETEAAPKAKSAEGTSSILRSGSNFIETGLKTSVFTNDIE